MDRAVPVGDLLARLSPVFDLTADSVADALWLAYVIADRSALASVHRANAAATPISVAPASPQQPLHGAVRTSAAPLAERPSLSSAPPPASATKDERTAALVLPGHEAAKPNIPIRARSVRIPAGTVLPNGLEIVRGLRSLPRRIASRTDRVLDEEATVDTTARCAGRLMPVLRPRTERWFEAALVTEHAPTSEMWVDTVTEFERLLRCSGLFRDVRRFSLRLTPQPRLLTPTGAERPIRSLRHPAARRVIFVFGSGTSVHWTDGSLAAVLATWGMTTPTVMVHALPERMWKHTVLGETDALVSNQVPGAANAALRATRVWWLPTLRGRQRPPVALPVVALDRESMHRWTSTVAARRGASASAFLLSVRGSAASNVTDVRERVRLFRANSSEAALQLAVRLASGPFTVPWMRVLQAVMGRGARHDHLAEILLSGLIERVTPIDAGVPAEEVQFRFLAPAAQLFRESLRDEDARETAEALRAYIHREYGSTADMKAWLVALDGDTIVIPAGAEPLLRTYDSLVDRLGSASLPEPPPTEQEEELPTPGSLLALFGPYPAERALVGARLLWVLGEGDPDPPERTVLEAAGASIEVAGTDEMLRDIARDDADLIVASLDTWRSRLTLDLDVDARPGTVALLLYVDAEGTMPIGEVGPNGTVPRSRVSSEIAAVLSRRRSAELRARVMNALIALSVNRATAERLFYQTTADIVRATQPTGSIRQLHQAVVAMVAAVTNCSGVRLFEDPGDGRVVLQAGAASSSKTLSPVTIAGRAHALRTTMWVPDVDASIYLPADDDTGSELVIPFQARPGSGGVLSVAASHLAAFTDDQIRWLESLLRGYYPLGLSSPERIEAQVRFDAGRTAFNEDRYADAIMLYTEALAFTHDVNIVRERAAAFWYEHRYEEAVADLNEVIDAYGETNFPARSSRGQILVEMGEYERALPDLDAAIEAFGAQMAWAAYTRRARGLAYAALGRFDEAEQDFALSRQGAPDNAWLDYSIALYLQMRGAPVAAILGAFGASLVAQQPSLNDAKRWAALEAVRQLGHVDAAEDELYRWFVPDVDALIAVASAARARRQFGLEVVARAAVAKLEGSLESHLELAAACGRAGDWQEARRQFHAIGEVVMARREMLKEAGQFDAVQEKLSLALSALELAQRETTRPVTASWLSGAFSRIATLLGGGRRQ